MSMDQVKAAYAGFVERRKSRLEEEYRNLMAHITEQASAGEKFIEHTGSINAEVAKRLQDEGFILAHVQGILQISGWVSADTNG